jgi:hypothetical protein
MHRLRTENSNCSNPASLFPPQEGVSVICKTFTPDNKSAIILLERSERANKVIANFMPRNIAIVTIAAILLLSQELRSI